MHPDRRAGFTLLEMLLVLLLLGLATSMVVATLPARSPDDALRQSQRLAQQLRWLAERAVVRGESYGLRVTTQHWQWQKLRYQPPAPPIWQPWEEKGVLPTPPLAPPYRLQLQMQGFTAPLSPDTAETPPLAPQIWLLPGGEIPSFRLSIIDAQDQLLAQIRVDDYGRILWLDGEQAERDHEK